MVFVIKGVWGRLPAPLRMGMMTPQWIFSRSLLKKGTDYSVPNANA
jgi:hypothetical protein